MGSSKYFFANLHSNAYLINLVETAFRKYVEPLYGDQTSAIKKIVMGADRSCDVFFIDGEARGLIVYKTTLQNEFGFHNAFELKTLLLFKSRENRGYGEYLLYRAEELAKAQHATYIYGTVSKKMPGLLRYLKKLDWLALKNASKSDKAKIINKDIIIVFKKLSYA